MKPDARTVVRTTRRSTQTNGDHPPRPKPGVVSLWRLMALALTGAVLEAGAAAQAGVLASPAPSSSLLIAQLERYDPATARHARAVAAYAHYLARRLGLSESQAAMSRDHALLHDMGKVKVPISILNKPGKLDSKEFSLIKRHPADGAAIVSQAGQPRGAEVAAWAHHERWDGKGYPRGLRGEGIPLEARIVAVADVFAALTEDRPHRPRMTFEVACKIIRDGSGPQFDSRLVERFLSDPAGLERLLASVREGKTPIGRRTGSSRGGATGPLR